MVVGELNLAAYQNPGYQRCLRHLLQPHDPQKPKYLLSITPIPILRVYLLFSILSTHFNCFAICCFGSTHLWGQDSFNKAGPSFISSYWRASFTRPIHLQYIGKDPLRTRFNISTGNTFMIPTCISHYSNQLSDRLFLRIPVLCL
jgi:hypothetical protein